MSKIQTQYNPWENKKTFIQNVGNAESILEKISSDGIDFIPSIPNWNEKKNIENENDKDENSNLNSITNTSILPLNIQKEYLSTESIVNSFEKLYDLIIIQYNKLEQLELIYEKHKYQNILNKQNNYELSQKLVDLINFFKEIKLNKDKLVYLLHNSGITDSHVVKIKHSKKMELQ